MARPSRTGGKKSEAKARNASPAKGRKTTRKKRPIARTPTRAKRPQVSGPSEDLKEAREQQAATAEILKIIASSPDDVQPVFEAIAASANRLIGGFSSAVYRIVNDMVHMAAFTPTTPEADAALQAIFPLPRTQIPALVMVESGQTAQIGNSETSDPQTVRIARARGWRSVLFTPLMNKGAAIGFIAVTRRETGMFADHHVQLLQTFADQAVIAIENARLFNEVQERTVDLSEALAHQTATAGVLEVIGSSMADVQPVFERILDITNSLVGIEEIGILLAPGDGRLHMAAHRGTRQEAFEGIFPMPIEETAAQVVMVEGRQRYFADALSDPNAPPSLARSAKVMGNYSCVITPMIWEGRSIGVISVARAPNAVFSEKELLLLQTFADQAVIAIQNARLFNETKEALERQTATADILKVIARSQTDVQPVFDAIAESAKRLLGSFTAVVTRVIDDMIHLAASTAENEAPAHAAQGLLPYPLSSDRIHARVARTGQIAVNTDAPNSDLPQEIKEFARTVGWRSMLVVPMLRNEIAVGTIAITRREAGPFDDKTVDLLKTFADQAVIAIENARLFNETQEALERQTATADILKVIASSPSDVQPVFDAIVHSAKRLLGGHSSGLYHIIDDTVHLKAFTPLNAESDEALRNSFPSPRSRVPQTALVEKGASFQFADTENAPEFQAKIARARGFRSILLTPLTQAGKIVGMVAVSRKDPGYFADHHVELMKTFADQAVIAIENVRLFNETKEALAHQTATSEVLQTIGNSMADTQPVFERILDSVERLFDIMQCSIMLNPGDGLVHLAARRGVGTEALDRLYPVSLAQTMAAEVLRARQQTYFPDARLGSQIMRRVAETAGNFSMVMTPMVWAENSIGVLNVSRVPNAMFSEKELGLLRTFADQAVIAIQNARLFNETREALEQQTATSEVLEIISSSPGELDPVFQKMLENACNVCGAHFGTMNLWNGEEFINAAQHNTPQAFAAFRQQTPIRPHPDTPMAKVARTHRFVHELDLKENPAYLEGVPNVVAIVNVAGARTILNVPMLKDDKLIGTITIFRQEVRPFTDKQIALVENFTKQAVIAIENTRLLRELRERTDDLSESLQQQTATGEVLKVIASSPTDVKPALQAIVESACTFCDAYDAGVLLRVGDDLHFSAHHGPIGSSGAPRPIGREWVVGRSVVDKVPVQVSDFQAPEAAEFPEGQRMSREQGHRCTLSVPLLREGEAIGAIVLRRLEPVGFSDKQVALLQTFADQAVIAIGNVRLFEEVQAKTRDLSEALTHQTGSANILRVIASSPTDVKPVLQAIVESACELCGAYDALVRLKEGDELAFGAHHGPLSVNVENVPISENSTAGLAVIGRKPVHVHDLLSADGDKFPGARALALGERTILSVPLLRESEAIGALVIRRREVNPFTDKQITLLQTFADQAVIAIGNVRLFEEVQARTHELAESLEQQTATSEVLSVISRSAGDLAPVFDAMLSKAMQLCDANFGVLNTYDGSRFHTAATHGLPPAYDEMRRKQPIEYGPGTAPARLLQGEPHVEILHLIDSEAYHHGDPNRRALVDIGGARSLLAVPLLKDGGVVGNVLIFRKEDNSFSEKQIALLKQFSAQAVIAIENARLLNELRQRTGDLSESLQQQTATSEVLQVISSSPGDLAPVFEKMLVNATRVCGAEFGSLLLIENGSIRSAAQYNVPAAFAAAREKRVLAPHPKSPLAVSILTKQVVHEADLRTTEPYLMQHPGMVELVEVGGVRTIAIVPMLRDDEVIGAISVYRNEVQLFSDKQIELLSNFAKQAVIAIENARLLKELRQRTDDLSKSLDDLRAAQDRLIQTEKLASLGQLTAGIAHEIKNPLNFVNNFSSLSAELTEELNDLLKDAALTDKMRQEVEELTRLLHDNLEKVVQHGKRADSIVKNMLLHSREGSGERRSANINALVDESLNLAYHGARAEKSGFNITLQRDFDANAGSAELFPQEITRALLNLISNGFYAATKRKNEDGQTEFEPTLRATTKSLGGSVEIRIRDNGAGITPEVKQKMFNPFFTTKPAGEGTGLGLSMTHDIIVKQHGGRIDVVIEPGQFTEFTIVLPRSGAKQ